MNNSKVKGLIITLNTIFLSIIIIFGPLAAYIVSLPNYMSLYQDNRVTKKLNEQELETITANIIGFFKNEQEIENHELGENIPSFTPDEISHLQDVRALTNKIMVVFYASIILFILLSLLLLNKKICLFYRSMGTVFISSALSVAVVLGLLFLFSQQFIPFFDRFHQMFFPQGNYLFPEDSLLITIFPLGFFHDFFFKMVTTLGIVIMLVLLMGIFLVILNKKRIRDYNGKDK